MAKRLRVWYLWQDSMQHFACVVGKLRITWKGTQAEADEWVTAVNKKSDAELVELVQKAKDAFKKHKELKGIK